MISDNSISSNESESVNTLFSSVSLDEIRSNIAQFAADRSWEQFHTPRNLLLALVGEIGELSEIFQWKGEVTSKQIKNEWSLEEKTHLGEELSDCLIYLCRLSDICGIDLSAAAKRKMELNAIKYPANLVKGSSKKYNQYKSQGNKLVQQEANNTEEQDSKNIDSS